MSPRTPVPFALMSKLAGRRVDSFDLVRVLGAGATGVVYLASDIVLRRNVALKLIPRSDDASDTLLHEVFMREARAAARLVHPNVVQIYQIGETNEFRYIAMEYVPGMNALRKAKRSGNRLPQDVCIKMMREAADALQLAATMGICHRDIKPSNLLLTPTASLKIADFGLAAQAGGSESIGAPNSEQIQGTAYYMSPEQWQGGDITTASDIYSLGCTIYRLLLGTPPYGKIEFFACLQAHCYAPIPDPLVAMPTIEPSFAGLLRRCMAKTASGRPSPAEIIELVDAVVQRRLHGATPAGRISGFEDTSMYTALAEGSVDERSSGSAARRRLHAGALEYSDDDDASTGVRPPSVDYNRAQREQTTSQNTSLPTYQSVFALTGFPFSDIRQPMQFWQGGPYGWALRTLGSQLAAGSRHFLLLGAPGSGRTFLCDMLQHTYPHIRTFRVEPQLLFGEPILLALCRQYGLEPHPGASFRFLSQVLLSHALPQERPDSVAVIILDSVDPDDVDILRDLQHIVEKTGSSNLAVILVGQNDLCEQLADRRAPPSLYRDAPLISLRPMTQQEILDYIHFRMNTIAGSSRGLELDKPMLQLLHMRSRGSPKLVNIYCHNALTIAALRGESKIGFESLRIGMRKTTYLTPRTAAELLSRGTRD